MSTTLFSNVKIFEGSKAKSKPGEVLIEGNRIKQVSQRRGAIEHSGIDEVIDAGGATLVDVAFLRHIFSKQSGNLIHY